MNTALRGWRTTVAAGVLVGACGGDDSVGSSGSSATTQTTGSATSGATASGATETEVTGGTLISESGAMTDGSTGGADGVVYSAVSIPGDPNQIQIRRRDDENGRCSWAILTDQSVGLLAIATPAGWTPQVGLTNTNASSCSENDPLVGGSIEASSGQGEILDGGESAGAVPCSLDLDFELMFTQPELSEVFQADGVTVDGCDSM